MTTEPREPLRSLLVNRYGTPIYNKLCDARANLSYIWVLDVWLQAADCLISRTTESKNQRRKKKRAFHRRLQEYTRKIFQAYLEGFLEAAKDLDPSEPLLNPKHPHFQSRLKEIYSRVALRIVSELMKDSHPRIEKTFSHSQQSDEEFARKENLTEVLREYCPWPASYRKGGNPHRDLHGSFFLLAVTEHLGKKRGRYELAARLLRTIRGSGKTLMRKSSPTELTRKRISKLKQAHPNWKSHVDSMTQVLS